MDAWFFFFFFQFSSVMFALGGDKDKWFSRVALSLICAGFTQSVLDWTSQMSNQ